VASEEILLDIAGVEGKADRNQVIRGANPINKYLYGALHQFI